MRLPFTGVLAAITLLLPGCGSEDHVPVTGSVVMDGKPLAGAAVTFHPIEGTKGEGGMGGTDAAGNFFLEDMRRQTGIIPGKYKVTVSLARLKKDPQKVNGVVLAVAPEDYVEKLPAHYSNAETTVLSATVGPNPEPIVLKLESRK